MEILSMPFLVLFLHLCKNALGVVMLLQLVRFSRAPAEPLYKKQGTHSSANVLAHGRAALLRLTAQRRAYFDFYADFVA